MGPNKYPSGIVFPSAAYAQGTLTSETMRSAGAFGLRVFLNITNVNGATITVRVKGVDPASGNTYDVYAATGVASNGLTVYSIFPTYEGAGTLAVSALVPDNFIITVQIASATATFSVGAELSQQFLV